MNYSKKIILIAAVARNGVIGCGGKMPWRISSDLKHFKAQTLGNPIVMGRNTFKAIGKALPDRFNIVITRNDDLDEREVITEISIQDALDTASKVGGEKIFVIGGGEVYAQTIILADELYITHVEAEIKGDVFFPEIDPTIWKKEKEISFSPEENDEYKTRFAIYFRS
ncbi:dihydrofolate reductase [Candidatus Liberibacter sp.]|uniref:dihydrofolate reductase n=1 Tax=Candidatus Liberibacter sp. TaxID=34022 RepID=UPI0015F36528|nr:dihydrofolate reductase [Candidatus Liberibacter sp.]MBA5724031.1 dihydrofolate reductase [Candidatus Liberibacter sp.]